MARPRIYDDALRQRLLEECELALDNNGVDGVNLRNLADNAGTSTSAIYTLFGGKKEIVDEVLTSQIEHFVATKFPEMTGDVITDTQAIAITYREWASSKPHTYNAISTGELSERLLCLLRELTKNPLSQLAEKSVAEGISHGDPEELAAALWATIHGVITLELTGNIKMTDMPYAATIQAILVGWDYPNKDL